jgi:deoxyadenosine/deoxycytidine kinase
MPVFTIDGNIGVGKSTLLEYLHTHYRLPIDPEPVERWQPFLENMYRNGRGAFEFQVRVWLDRCWIQTRPNMAPILLERSPFFQRNVFVPAMFDGGKIDYKEYCMLQEMYDKSGSVWCPNGCIYLRSNPMKCLERIQKRARPGEEQISAAYLYKLHSLHEYTYMSAVMAGIPIICVDVEGKTVSQIAAEVWVALSILGYGIAPPPPHVPLP